MTNRLSYVLTILIIVLTPLFFWTITPNFFIQSKLLVLFTLGLILSFAFFIKLITSKSLTLPKSSLAIAFAVFFLAIASSLVMVVEGRPEAIATTGSLLLFLPLLSIFVMSLPKSKDFITTISSTLMIVADLLAFYSLLQLTIFPTLSFLPSFMQTKLFTLTGDYLTTLIIILLGIGAAIPRLKSGTQKLNIFPLLTLVIGTIVSVAIISLMMPGSALALTLVPYQETWSITLDALKSPRSLFFGVGIANFSSLFTAVKPLSLNASSVWNQLPATSTSAILNLFITTGIIGGLATIYIFIQGLRTAKNTTLQLPVAILTLALIFGPGSIPLFTLYFLILASTNQSDLHTLKLDPRLAIFLSLTAIAFITAGYTYELRSVVAEHYMTSAQTALKNNDGKNVYDNNLKAIKSYPKITAYHISFAETNLRLASALSQKQNLSDEEKSTISSLVQQAISEGKIAISLRPSSSSTWLALAKIYRNLINVASSADGYAIDNYARAVSLDPANPSLRVEFGGLFYQLGVNASDPKNKDAYFSRAKSELQTAIQLRANLPNAYYNLAKLYETMGDYENSYLAMQKTVSLLGSDNSDLGQAQSELDTIKSKLPKPTPTPLASPSTSEAPAAETSPLTTPTPLPSPISGNPIQL